MRTGNRGIASKHQKVSSILGRACCAGLLFFMPVIPTIGRAQVQQQTKPTAAESSPEPAAPAILAAFDKYEVVGMSEAHGMKDVDDFILSLIRNRAFPEKVNDIAVECGNSLYQPILDRYIAGEDVPFAEVRKVWRNTTQSMCGTSGFFEQFFPLVRAINQKLPAANRLRVLAGDPPIDWENVKRSEDITKFLDRDGSIAAVMEEEVLSKHRKALMLFGIFHLMHGAGIGAGNAVTIYEKHYPKLTFVIGSLDTFDQDLAAPSKNSFENWPAPSLARAKGTWLGGLQVSSFLPTPISVDEDCNVHSDPPKNLQKPMADLVDAFLYLGPQDLALWEQMPADIALDADYRLELQRRESLSGFPSPTPGSLKEADKQIMSGAENPVVIKPPDPKSFIPLIRQGCLDRKNGHSTAQ